MQITELDKLCMLVKSVKIDLLEYHAFRLVYEENIIFTLVIVVLNQSFLKR